MSEIIKIKGVEYVKLEAFSKLDDKYSNLLHSYMEQKESEIAFLKDLYEEYRSKNNSTRTDIKMLIQKRIKQLEGEE